MWLELKTGFHPSFLQSLYFIHPKNRLKIQSKNPLIESANHSTGLKEASSSKGQVVNAKKTVTPIMPRKINSLIFTVAFPSVSFLLLASIPLEECFRVGVFKPFQFYYDFCPFKQITYTFKSTNLLK